MRHYFIYIFVFQLELKITFPNNITKHSSFSNKRNKILPTLFLQEEDYSSRFFFKPANRPSLPSRRHIHSQYASTKRIKCTLKPFCFPDKFDLIQYESVRARVSFSEVNNNDASLMVKNVPIIKLRNGSDWFTNPNHDPSEHHKNYPSDHKSAPFDFSYTLYLKWEEVAYCGVWGCGTEICEPT